MTDATPESATPATQSLRGAAAIADVVKRLPNGPGVYRMIDGEGTVVRAMYGVRPDGHAEKVLRAL